MENNKEKTRYSDSELKEFKEIILEKLRIAREELASLTQSLSNPNLNGTDDTSGTYKTLEDGSATLEKEQINQLAARQKKFIESLEAAMVRIENKTYGICRETGKLIQKERLRAVPHATLSMEAKNETGVNERIYQAGFNDIFYFAGRPGFEVLDQTEYVARSGIQDIRQLVHHSFYRKQRNGLRDGVWRRNR